MTEDFIPKATMGIMRQYFFYWFESTHHKTMDSIPNPLQQLWDGAIQIVGDN